MSKGSGRRKGADDNKYKENWEKIYGTTDQSSETKNDEDVDEITQSIREGQDGEGC